MLILSLFNLFSFIPYIGYNRIPPIEDKICLSPEIRDLARFVQHDDSSNFDMV